MTTVVLIGTLDTKGAECAFLRDRLRDGGVDVVVVDTGIGEHDHDFATIGADEVARAGGADLAALREARDRGSAVAAMAEGARATVLALRATKQCDGVLAAGGSGNTSIATAAMRALPIGLPKLMVSTVAAGDVSAYVGAVDITMMASVVDIAGINSISSRILANAAAAMTGMVTAPAPPAPADDRPLVAASMFGVTTPCVTRAREQLERDGYEVLVFHATGTGGRALEGLASAGHLAGVLDVTTTELADEVVGGTLTAGPDRLDAAGRAGIPQAVSLGAVDMVNFGAMASVPERFRERNLYAHNDSVTLMRTTPEECAEIGRRIAAKLSAATGPTALFVPLRGVSMIATDGGPFHDTAADEALLDAVRGGLDREVVELIEMDCDVNDEAFADAMAGWLAGQIEALGTRG
jgi:uncharacterized protein (UPF0261 family)